MGVYRAFFEMFLFRVRVVPGAESLAIMCESQKYAEWVSGKQIMSCKEESGLCQVRKRFIEKYVSRY